MKNVISVDVEEYFHAANLSSVAGPRHWRSLPSRVEYTTQVVLDLFAKHSVRGTFFVLGYCARRYPEMVRKILAAGHELASHGYGHRIAYQQTKAQFYRDVSIAKKVLEDISGVEVRGYRAPNFSITEQTPWAYEMLVNAGYQYDSSIYPVWHPRYANTAESLVPTKIELAQGSLLRFPLAVAAPTVLGKEFRLPVAGGAYWRLLPKYYNYWGLRSISKASRGFVCYFHPWELDSGQPYYSQLPLRKRLRHYGNTASFADRIAFFLKRFAFSSFADAAAELLSGQEQCETITWSANECK